MAKGPGGDRARNINLIHSESLTFRVKPEEKERILRLVKEGRCVLSASSVPASSRMTQQEILRQIFEIGTASDDQTLLNLTLSGMNRRHEEWLHHMKKSMKAKGENGRITRLSPKTMELIGKGAFGAASKNHFNETGFKLGLMEIRDEGEQIDIE